MHLFPKIPNTIYKILNTTSDLHFVLLTFCIWRLYLFAAALLGLYFIPLFEPSFPYYQELLLRGHPLWFSWANFDGVHYLFLIEFGYKYDYTEVFFPAYWLLSRIIYLLTDSSIFAGLLISHLSFITALYGFLKLGTQFKLSIHTNRLALILLLAFPTSLFFAGVYTESLFLALTIWTLVFLDQKRYFLAGLIGGFAAATRVTGVLITSIVLRRSIIQKHLKPLLITGSLIALGLAIYMTYLWYIYQDPIYFVHIQPEVSSHRDVDHWVVLPQVWYRYLKILLTVPWYDVTYPRILMELASSIFFLIFSYQTLRRFGWGIALYMFISLILPTLTGSFSSLPRYVIVLFPAYWIMAIWLKKRPLTLIWWLGWSICLLTFNTILFTRGWWVA